VLASVEFVRGPTGPVGDPGIYLQVEDITRTGFKLVGAGPTPTDGNKGKISRHSRVSVGWMAIGRLPSEPSDTSLAGSMNPPNCSGVGKSLQWDGSAWACSDSSTASPSRTAPGGTAVAAPAVGSSTSSANPPDCEGFGKALQWSDKALQASGNGWKCVDDMVRKPPRCVGFGRFLQWDGENWVCVRYAGDVAIPP
jgi:hypothetical protein